MKPCENCGKPVSLNKRRCFSCWAKATDEVRKLVEEQLNGKIDS
jgi:predicted amidophosphoribosyltransferase